MQNSTYRIITKGFWNQSPKRNMKSKPYKNPIILFPHITYKKWFFSQEANRAIAVIISLESLDSKETQRLTSP